MATLPSTTYQDWEERQALLAIVRAHREQRQRRGHGDKHLNGRAAYEARLQARIEHLESALAKVQGER